MAISLFPYPQYYPNQREIIEFIINASANGLNPVFESPTGSGKTIAVLSALIPFARESSKKILYLCRTHEQMDRVIEELKMIAQNETILGLSLRSRKDMCFNEYILGNTLTEGEERFACSILKKEGKCDYYSNLKKRSLKFMKPLTASELIKESRIKEICPYEVSRSFLSDCEVITCSYLYVFEPGIRQAFLKSLGKDLDEFILVLDEAHNLPKLATNLAGERLTLYAVERALKEAEEYGVEGVDQFLEKIYKFLALNDSLEKRIEKKPLLSYLGDDLDSIHILEYHGEEIKQSKLSRGKRPISFLEICASFIRHWLECDEDTFAFFASKTARGVPYFEILSLEPRMITRAPLEEAFLSVHMSGTLMPFEPYCDVVALSNFICQSFPSPFPRENVTALIDTSVSTLGSLRTSEMYDRIAKRIQKLLFLIPGNVLVFFPSYALMDSVLRDDLYVEKYMFREQRHMTSGENNEMIKEFKRTDNAVLFGVQQGRNSEGQDFPGKQARAVIVVGLPYAKKGPRVKAQIEYYKKTFKGWWGKYHLGEYYAYFLPAYRSLNQSAGRAHRKLTDKAAIIFLERRVAFDKKVAANISPWIKENIKVPSDLEIDVTRFFET
jgi:DNA excision repair protein ERCC-2